MNENLANKTALITGGGTGIGAAATRLLRSQGCNVVVTGRRENVLDEISSQTGAISVAGDVSRKSDIEKAVNIACEEFSGLDFVVANAGVIVEGDVANTSDEDWQSLLDINLSGVRNTLQVTLPELKKRGGGSVVIVSSISGLMAAPRLAAYMASKSAVIGLAKSAALDFGSDNIRVNALCPGWVSTEMSVAEVEDLADMWGISKSEASTKLTQYIPLKRMAAPEEIASCIAFLLSDNASFVSGTVLTADGGGSCVDVGMLAFLQ